MLRHPVGATDLVLLAHGGSEHSSADPHLWSGAILRMWPFAQAVRSAVPEAAIGLMRYRYRGWNGAAADPAVDLRAVLDGLPPLIRRVVLIGHSMGGRAVVAAGDHPRVAGVLALAPWLPDGEPLTVRLGIERRTNPRPLPTAVPFPALQCSSAHLEAFQHGHAEASHRDGQDRGRR